MDGIFLHSTWRSCGTWLWEKLRNQPQYLGFYEPLHEFLPGLTEAKIAALNSGNWQSGHPRMSHPYFTEYMALLEQNQILKRRKGVAGARSSFAFDRFFLKPTEAHEELYGYVQALCETAQASGRRPVLKFARSQGRYAWFAAHFPNHAHALLIRQPWAKFRSAWRCLVEDENPYFLAAPFMVLERNAAEPDVAALIQALHLPVRAHGAPLVWRLKHWLRSVHAVEPATLYRACLALWLLNTAKALPHAQLVLDGDSPSTSQLASFGLTPEDTIRPVVMPLRFRPPLALGDVRATHEMALGTLAPRLDARMPHRLGAWLAPAESDAARDLAPHLEIRLAPPHANLLRRAAGHLRPRTV